MIVAFVWFALALATIAFTTLSMYVASRELQGEIRPAQTERAVRHAMRRYAVWIAVQVFFIASPTVILLFPDANPEGWREATAIALLFAGQSGLCYASYQEWRYRVWRHERSTD